MATKATRVTKSTVSVPPKYGKLIVEKDRILLEAGKEQYELDPTSMSAAEIKAMTGKKVELVYSEPQSFVIGVQLPGKKPILCYLPIPLKPSQLCYLPVRRPPVTCYIVAKPKEDLLANVANLARQDLLEQLVAGKVITAEVYNKLKLKKDILCYIPRPDFMDRVRVDLRIDMANQLLSEGIISKEVHGRIV